VLVAARNALRPVAMCNYTLHPPALCFMLYRANALGVTTGVEVIITSLLNIAAFIQSPLRIGRSHAGDQGTADLRYLVSGSKQ